MEKENAVRLLEKNGFTAAFESGVPMAVYEGGEKEMNDTYEKAVRILRDNGCFRKLLMRRLKRIMTDSLVLFDLFTK